MKKMLILLSIMMLIPNLVIAENPNANTKQQAIAIQRIQLQNEVMSNIRERIQNNEEIDMLNMGVTIRKISAETMELRNEKGNLVRTRLQLNNEGNSSQLKARLSNGRNIEIKIMPETASQRAIERLKLRNCDGNCTIELKEVGQGNKTRIAYEAKVHKTFRLFGFIKRNREILTQIDAETGEEILTKRPWWSFLASESEG